MPRLSVDIDLTYLELDDRKTALENIKNELHQITDKINKNVTGAKAIMKATSKGLASKVIAQRDDLEIKIEPNFVLRRVLFPTRIMAVTDKVSDIFEFSYKVPILSFEDLYGSKICAAALDRQHPRDLFDIKYLFENEGITDSLRQAFLVYLLSHTRPIHEVLQPNELDISEKFIKEFSGMVREEINLREFIGIRKRLIETIDQSLTEQERKFLVTFQNAEPDWSIFPLDAREFPAIKWKLMNLNKLKSQNSEKHRFLSDELKKKLKL